MVSFCEKKYFFCNLFTSVRKKSEQNAEIETRMEEENETHDWVVTGDF